MNTDKREPVTAVHSATILLVRDGVAGLEVFMVRRHHEVDFASGALVFPGGKVADGDREARVRALSDGADALSDGELALQAAAIRESFEECGVLLARRRGAGSLIDPTRLAALDHYRKPLDRGETALGAFLEAEDLAIACDQLVPFGHWITPATSPKRFDTWFFLAAAPPDQAALHDGMEAVDSFWLPPAQVVAEANAGQHALVFATRMNLMRLAESETVDAAVAAARKSKIVAVMPRLEKRPEGDVVCIPADAGYALTEVPVPVARGAPWPEAPG